MLFVFDVLSKIKIIILIRSCLFLKLNSNYQENQMQATKHISYPNNISLRQSNNQHINKSMSSPYRQLSTTCFANIHSNRSQSYRDSHQYLKPCCQGDWSPSQFIFQPEIHELPIDLYPDQEGYQLSRQQRYERLLEDSRQKIRARISTKLQKENANIQNACTFHPQISDFSKAMAKQIDNQIKRTIFDKLYEDAPTKERKASEVIRNHRSKEMQQIRISQQPKHSNYWKFINKEKHDLEPLYTRILKVMESRKQHQKELQQKLRMESTFNPEISQQSKQIVRQKIDKEELKANVVDRLFTQYKRQQEKLEKLRDDHEKQQKEKHPFKPSINQYCESNKGKEFISRLRRLSNKCYHDDQLYTFKPEINQLSNLLIKHLRKGGQDQQQKLDRLAYEPTLKKLKNLIKIQEEAYQQCVFNPQINEISNAFKIQKPCKHKCPQPIHQTYSFKPTINQKSRMIRSRSTETNLRHKKKEAEKYKHQQQYNELKQCTFRPKTNNFRHQGLHTVKQVEGVNRFMQRIIRMKTNQQQQKQYEDKIFHLQHKYDERIKR